MNMRLNFRRSLLTAAVLTATLLQNLPLQAGCHGRSGRFSYPSHGHSHSHVHYRHTTYAHPVYPAQRPVYVEPQPVYTYPQPDVAPYASAPAPASQVAPFPQSMPLNQLTAAPGQPFAAGGQPQPVSGLVGATAAPAAATGMSGLNSAGVSGGSLLPATTPATATATAGLPTGSTAAAGAEASALQALGGFAPPQDTPAVAQNSPAPLQASNADPGKVGSWRAAPGNGAQVQLELRADGTFSWSATNKSGNTSRFDGRYSLNSTALTLIRSGDNQQLSGGISSGSPNQFSFQLTDSQSARLEFTRS